MKKSMLSKIFPSYQEGLAFRHVSLVATVTLFLTIVFGTAVSVQNGTGCPDWPTCLGSFGPPQEPAAFMEYLHRALTGMSFVLLSATVLWGLRLRQRGILLKSHLAAWVVLLVQVTLGGIPALRSQAWLGTIHLGLALVVQSLALVGTAAAFLLRDVGTAPVRLRWQTPFARLSLLAGGLIFVLLVSGALVADLGATAACQGWPLCSGALIPADFLGQLNMLHRLIVLLTGAVVIKLLGAAWQTQRTQTGVLVSATAMAALFASQALMGAVNAEQAYPGYLVMLHTATSVAIWGTSVLLIAQTGWSSRTTSEEVAEAAAFKQRQIRGMLKDFLLLTKPIVVALLLVTTFAGMVIGAQDWPPASLVIWTMLGGFLAAGGSGAINQYIDRADDLRMQRTSRRPIPDGRLEPGEGLAFGVAISLISFFLLVAMVNFLAALLSLAGIIYYVVLYSLILKKTTVQNIVIGGGAGAIPPLVGWAAATGSLTIPSLLLFAVVFMWTPPHFWALAIVRRKDYARAGVPMLPVVRGEKETRWLVFLYTLELVALTLILPVFGLGSSLYLIAAVVLGGLLLLSAYRVWKQEGNKIAWKMYRHSSMYLAFLFLALMVDRLVL
jgi:protoheme IX farnesyltransferase